MAETGERTSDVWGSRQAYGRDGTWPQRQDMYLKDGLDESAVDRWVGSACLLCSNGCGLDIAVKDDEIVGVRGRVNDRVNHGRLGPKGLYGWQGQQRDRLTGPLIREHGRLVPADWDTAMNRIVERSQGLLDDKGGSTHGFYTSGQLMLEEYYAFGVLGKAGIGTPHMDGNTRLCTATAAASLKESFGTDGQPGTEADVDSCDALFLYGHNMAHTQTVFWSRVLDRLAGSDPPAIVCVDPRRTPVAERASLHLPVRSGTNQALMNALVHEVIERGWYDDRYVAAHTVGLHELRETVAECPPAVAAGICGVPARDIERAAEIFATSERVLSTVLQGFYQSHQATAASCQVNNLHLLRGMLGSPGCGVLQMNGQPTAQNNRECGADGDLPGFRNWDNKEHVRQLAELWNVDPMTIPHWSPPTHAMQLFRYVEQGSIRFLWIAGTNPLVSLPELGRIREAMAGDECFVVVADGYLTETTEYADVVLPAALWGEKTGTYTNTDRTVHLSEQAVPPPGTARSDLDMILDYCRRMDFTDRDGNPLLGWDGPEQAFEAWKECSRGRPCDYTGLTYYLLRERGGVQWPVTADRPDGTERLYSDHVFNTDADLCETYGHELTTGAVARRGDRLALHTRRRAILTAAAYVAPHETASDEFPLALNTGRVVHHFHTRTKTGRAPELAHAAPRMWVEASRADADTAGLNDGDPVRVVSPRGAIVTTLRVTDADPGQVFVPFHYGDEPANELTMTVWDPVSKQPAFKGGAVRLEKVM